jgi:hypothetical protein
MTAAGNQTGSAWSFEALIFHMSVFFSYNPGVPC